MIVDNEQLLIVDGEVYSDHRAVTDDDYVIVDLIDGNPVPPVKRFTGMEYSQSTQLFYTTRSRNSGIELLSVDNSYSPVLKLARNSLTRTRTRSINRNGHTSDLNGNAGIIQIQSINKELNLTTIAAVNSYMLVTLETPDRNPSTLTATFSNTEYYNSSYSNTEATGASKPKKVKMHRIVSNPNLRYSGSCSEPNCTHTFQSASQLNILRHFRELHGRNIEVITKCHLCGDTVDSNNLFLVLTHVISNHRETTNNAYLDVLMNNFRKFNESHLLTACGLDLKLDESPGMWSTFLHGFQLFSGIFQLTFINLIKGIDARINTCSGTGGVEENERSMSSSVQPKLSQVCPGPGTLPTNFIKILLDLCAIWIYAEIPI